MKIVLAKHINKTNFRYYNFRFSIGIDDFVIINSIIRAPHSTFNLWLNENLPMGWAYEYIVIKAQETQF